MAFSSSPIPRNVSNHRCCCVFGVCESVPVCVNADSVRINWCMCVCVSLSVYIRLPLSLSLCPSVCVRVCVALDLRSAARACIEPINFTVMAWDGLSGSLVGLIKGMTVCVCVWVGVGVCVCV